MNGKGLRWIVCTHQVILICISRWHRRIWRRVSACPCICHICKKLNLYNDNKLLVFPIKDLTETNPVYILTNKDKVYVEGTDEFKNLLENAVEDLEVCDI